MMSRFDAVLFDFDGTLVPCLDLAAMKREVVAFTCTATDITEAQAQTWLAVELIEHAAVRLEAAGQDGAAFREEANALVRAIELEAAARTQPFPGVRELLGRLRTLGVAAGVVTRNCSEAVELMFPDLHRYCGAVLARDDVAHLKPDVRHLERALELLGAAPGSAVMVGDGALDMQAGRALGMHCVGVLGGHNGQDALEAAGADCVLPNVAGLDALLDRAGVPA